MKSIDIGNPLEQVTLVVTVHGPGRLRRFLGMCCFKIGAWIYGFEECDVK